MTKLSAIKPASVPKVSINKRGLITPRLFACSQSTHQFTLLSPLPWLENGPSAKYLMLILPSYMACYNKKCIWTSPKASLIRIIPHILASFTSLFMGLNKPLDLGFNVFPLIEDLGFHGSTHDPHFLHTTGSR